MAAEHEYSARLPKVSAVDAGDVRRSGIDGRFCELGSIGGSNAKNPRDRVADRHRRRAGTGRNGRQDRERKSGGASQIKGLAACLR